MEQLSELRKKAADNFSRKTLGKLGLLALVFLPLIFFTDYAVTALLALSAILAAGIIHRLHLRQTGVELTTFATIITGMAHGPLIGGVTGFILIMLQMFIGQYSGLYIFWVVPSYAIAGAVAGFLGASSITATGIGIVIGLHAVFSSFTAILTSRRLPSYLMYALLNIIFNVALFVYVAPQIVSMIG